MKVSQRVSELETQTVGSTQGWSHLTQGHNSITRIPRNTVSRLPALFHKIEVNL